LTNRPDQVTIISTTRIQPEKFIQAKKGGVRKRKKERKERTKEKK